MVEGGGGEPNDKLLGVGDGGPKLRLWGPGDGTPRPILESESSLRVGLWDVSLHLRGLADILLLPLPDWCLECANWAAANCWCCNLEQRWKWYVLSNEGCILLVRASHIDLDEGECHVSNGAAHRGATISHVSITYDRNLNYYVVRYAW